MKAAQVRGLTLDQLNDELVKLKKEQFNLRFQAASGQLENTARVREIRRDIARIQTITRQKNAAGMLLAEVLSKQGIISGIKVDTSAKVLAGSPDEKTPKGLMGSGALRTVCKKRVTSRPHGAGGSCVPPR